MMNDYSFLKIRRVWQNTADIIPRICTFIGRDTSSCWPILRSVSGVFILQRFRYNGRFVWTISLLFIRIYHQIKPYITRIYHKMSDVTRSHHLIFVRYHETHQWLEQFLLRACPLPPTCVRVPLRPTTATSSDAPTDHHLCNVTLATVPIAAM